MFGKMTNNAVTAQANAVDRAFCPNVSPRKAIPSLLPALNSSLMIPPVRMQTEHMFASLYYEHLFDARPNFPFLALLPPLQAQFHASTHCR
jgi:hypothetical protein